MKLLGPTPHRPQVNVCCCLPESDTKLLRVMESGQWAHGSRQPAGHLEFLLFFHNVILLKPRPLSTPRPYGELDAVTGSLSVFCWGTCKTTRLLSLLRWPRPWHAL